MGTKTQLVFGKTLSGNKERRFGEPLVAHLSSAPGERHTETAQPQTISQHSHLQ